MGVLGESGEIDGREPNRHENSNLLRAIQKGIAATILIVSLSALGTLLYYPVGGETGQLPSSSRRSFEHFIKYDSLNRLCFPRWLGDDRYSFDQDPVLLVSRFGGIQSATMGIMGDLYFPPHSTRSVSLSLHHNIELRK